MNVLRSISPPSNIKKAYLPRALLAAGAQQEESLTSELELELERSPERKTLILERMISSRESRPKSLRTTGWRWLALALVCMVNFALYYCYNNPQALQPIIESELHIGDSKYNLLYSVYSLPNIILPFFGGYLVDRIGVRAAINIFGFILIIGQAIFAYGAYMSSFGIMVAGRFVFGVGGESLAVSQLPMVSKWFSAIELSFAWGFGRAAIRVGSSLNSFFTPKIYLWTGSIAGPFFVGAVITVFSWLSGLVLAYMDRLADKQEGELEKGVVAKSRFHFTDLKSLPFIFYLMLVNYPCLYGSFFGLSNNINNIMVERFGFDVNQVGNLVMIIYLAAAAVGPFFGPFLDKYGKRIRVMFYASVLFLLTEIQILMLSDRPAHDPNYMIIMPLVGISLFYAVYSVVFWPCLPLIVEKKILGTVTGVITAVFNLMLTLFPLILGAIHDHTREAHHGYFWTEITICAVISMGILSTLWIYYEDLRRGGLLDKSPHEKLGKDVKGVVDKEEKNPLILNDGDDDEEEKSGRNK